jgi:hypothetical protein
MTPKRIAELFQLTLLTATVNPQRDKQALKECLDEIARLQKELEAHKCSVCGMELRFHGETCTAGGEVAIDKCCATCFHGQLKPITCLCLRNPQIKDWWKNIVGGPNLNPTPATQP